MPQFPRAFRPIQTRLRILVETDPYSYESCWSIPLHHQASRFNHPSSRRSEADGILQSVLIWPWFWMRRRFLIVAVALTAPQPCFSCSIGSEFYRPSRTRTDILSMPYTMCELHPTLAREPTGNKDLRSRFNFISWQVRISHRVERGTKAFSVLLLYGSEIQSATPL